MPEKKKREYSLSSVIVCSFISFQQVAANTRSFFYILNKRADVQITNSVPTCCKCNRTWRHVGETSCCPAEMSSLFEVMLVATLKTLFMCASSCCKAHHLKWQTPLGYCEKKEMCLATLHKQLWRSVWLV